MSKYNLFIESNESFIPYKADGTYKELPSGAYSPWINLDTGQVFFDRIKLQSDDIVDLPSKEYEYVVGQMQHFLKEGTKAKFKENGFVYKRSVLMHGKPGTGKTCIVSRVVKEALKNNAVVLFNPNPGQMPQFFQALEETAPDKLTLVVFEEIDEHVGSSRNESEFLSILDGEIQKNNVIYLATTNYIDQIPLRFQRPGRFSSIVEVGFPSTHAREVYLRTKKVDPAQVSSWAAKTEGFSIDELKETVLAVKCLDESLETVVKRVKDLKEQGLQSESKKTSRADQAEELLESIFQVAKPSAKRR